MDLVLTLGEVAERLELDCDTLRALFEEGYLSGFRHGEEWRITHTALMADLERLRRQLEPGPKAQLAPKSDSAFRIPPTLFPKMPRLPEKSVYPERFIISVELENDSDYTGPFAVCLGTENIDGPWDIQLAGDALQDERELLVRGSLGGRNCAEFFHAVLHGTIGDRLFVAIPQQGAVNDAVERVFVIEDDLTLRVTLSNRGLFGRKRSARIKQIAARELPRTGTE